jgi:hypothetical protein
MVVKVTWWQGQARARAPGGCRRPRCAATWGGWAALPQGGVGRSASHARRAQAAGAAQTGAAQSTPPCNCALAEAAQVVEDAARETREERAQARAGAGSASAGWSYLYSYLSASTSISGWVGGGRDRRRRRRRRRIRR